jgi:branched-chain amino acid transport system permease protein
VTARASRSLPRLEEARVRPIFNTAAAVLAFYFAQQWFLPAPAGVLLQGVLLGSLTALTAFGLSFVYRTTRVINFAQADLGGVAAITGVLLVAITGVPYVVGFLAAIAGAAVLGAIVERTIIRRFFKATRLIVTVVTIALAQVMIGAQSVIRSIWPSGNREYDPSQVVVRLPNPLRVSFKIGQIAFQGSDIVVLVVLPLIVAGLIAFFRFTNIGIAVRASAESTERALLLGIPVKRIHNITWMLATVLSAIGLWFRAGLVGVAQAGTASGPSQLLRGLAAVVIARMESLPRMLAASIGIGVLEQTMIWSRGRGDLVDPLLFVVILVVLLAQRHGGVSRAEDSQTSTWQASETVRGVPSELARLPEVRAGLGALKAAGLALLMLVPVLLPESRVNLVGAILIFGIIGLSLVVLTGWGGQISLGQMAFVGVGGAVAGYLTTARGWDLMAATIIAGLVGAAWALVVGLPALRIRGLFLAVTTLAFALTTSAYFLNSGYIRWLPTSRIERPALLGIIDIDTETRFYYFVLVGFVAVLLLVRNVRRSRTGRVLIGTRDNERGVQAYGVNPVLSKVTAFGISGFLAAYAGSLFVHHQHALGTTAFLPTASLQVFAMVVIGGLGSVPGALIGAAYVRGIEWFMPAQVKFLASGFGLLLVLLTIPGGLARLVYDARDWVLRRVARRRGLLVPALLTDTRPEPELAPAAP